jgi:hypothetical protein
VTAIFPHQSDSLQLYKHRSRDENCDHLAIRRSEAHIKGIASVDQLNRRWGLHGDGEREKRFIG